MSGNFVQRGEPAIIDKWTRTKMALENGIDLVLELPVIYSLSSAEFFAQGAVTILHKLGVVNSICFGSECGEINILNYIASILVNEPQEYKKILKSIISTGVPYPTARSKALTEYTNSAESKYNIEEVLRSSNNILGIEYCKSLIKNNSNIKPYTIQRKGGAYTSKDLDDVFSSATAIRELLRTKKNLGLLESHVPPSSFSIIKSFGNNYCFTFPEDMYIYLKYKLLQNPSKLSNLPDVGEGLDNRIYSSFLNSNNYNEFINAAKTKRYTYTRIARCLCQYFIGFELFNTVEMRKSDPEYVRILGFNKKGAEILRKSKTHCSINIQTKISKSVNPMIKLDILSTKMYSVINDSVSVDSDFKVGPIIYK